MNELIGKKLVLFRAYGVEPKGTEFIFKGIVDDEFESVVHLEGGKPFNLPGDSHVQTVGSILCPVSQLTKYFELCDDN